MSDTGESEKAVPEAKKRRRKQPRQRRERGRLHLTLKSSGIYYITGTVADTRVYESTGTSSFEHAEHLRTLRERELMDAKVHGKQMTWTFADAVKHYHSVKGTTNSYSRYIPALEAEFGKLKLREITGQLVTAYAQRHHAGVSPVVKNTYVVNPMATILRAAALAGMCPHTVLPRFKGASKKVHATPQDVIDKFREVARPDLAAIVAFVTVTGRRCIDACRMLKEHVNPNELTVLIPTTKNGQPFVCHVPGALMQILEQQMARNPGAYVWSLRNTNNVDKEIGRECKRKGVPHFSMHAVGRHAFVERLLALGYSLHQIMAMGGWDDLATLQKRYGHLEQKKVHEDVRRVGADVLKPKLKVVGEK